MCVRVYAGNEIIQPLIVSRFLFASPTRVGFHGHCSLGVSELGILPGAGKYIQSPCCSQ